MTSSPDSAVVADDVAPAGPPPPAWLPAATWLREGLRAGLFLRPRVGAAQPGPWQILALVAFVSAIELVLGRFEIHGPAVFNLRPWLAQWWMTGALLFLVWAVLRAVPADAQPRPAGVAAWFALWVVALLPSGMVSQGLAIAQAHDVLPAVLAASPWFGWTVYLGLIAWVLGAGVWLSRQFGLGRRQLATLAAGMVALLGLHAWQFHEQAWSEDQSVLEQNAPPRLELSQEVFETQLAVWDKAVQGLAPERPGVTDVYGLVFAPFAQEDVFLRESAMVSRLLAERFDAGGRVLHLANHATTADAYPWATPLNLKRAVEALAERMDRAQDVLVVYLTSHGASNFKLAATHWPLQVDALGPGELRVALDEAGIKHRVIAVSACYSGGWVGPLASDTTLVMTAADATQTSYGCGTRSELTFFGRALFAEQLRKTWSFEQAFAAAVPVIRQREVEAGKPDGFSNPQIAVGAGIRPVLKALEERLGALPRP